MNFSNATRRSTLRSIFRATGLVIATSVLGACATTQQDTIVYLVRHAEKDISANAGKNPSLTAEGEARAKLLVDLLSAEPITFIHSSDYIRTRSTAAPLASAKNLDVEIYDPRDLPALVAKIRTQNGQHLVIGHSNTIPETVTALGGDGGEAIAEKTEYDRLYKVSLSGDGTVHTDLQRYGVRSQKPK